ncbi:hypothetical protein Dimus_017291 [Dionaea muscipula]
MNWLQSVGGDQHSNLVLRWVSTSIAGGTLLVGVRVFHRLLLEKLGGCRRSCSVREIGDRHLVLHSCLQIPGFSDARHRRRCWIECSLLRLVIGLLPMLGRQKIRDDAKLWIIRSRTTVQA